MNLSWIAYSIIFKLKYNNHTARNRIDIEYQDLLMKNGYLIKRTSYWNIFRLSNWIILFFFFSCNTCNRILLYNGINLSLRDFSDGQWIVSHMFYKTKIYDAGTCLQWSIKYRYNNLWDYDAGRIKKKKCTSCALDFYKNRAWFNALKVHLMNYWCLKTNKVCIWLYKYIILRTNEIHIFYGIL